MKNRTKSLIYIIVLLLVLVTSTYAFFRPQGDLFKSRDISATSNTTDYLSFQISNDISFRVTQADFAQGNGNKYGETTATAVLTPNNKTGEGTANYYMYLNLTNNGIVYSSTNTNHYPELLLQVFDSNDDLVEIDYFADTVTYGLLEGYDITGVTGLIPLLNNHEISASNGETTTETWRVVITMINLDVDQQDNTNKEINASISIQKDVEIAPTVRIAYNANGGVGSMSSETIDNLNGDAISKNTFTRDGYYFYGWNTEPDGSGDTYVDLAKIKEVPGTDNLTLYAHWENSSGLYNTRTKEFTPWDSLGLTVTNGEIEESDNSEYLEGILVIPNSVTSIGEDAFEFSELISVTIPSNVTTIEDYAFWYAESLSSVIIENGVTSIGDYAFEGTALTSFIIPNSVTTIGEWAFSGSKISNITIPSSVTSIGEAVLSFSQIDTISVDPANTVYDSRNNSNAIIETSTNKLIQGSSATIIPNTVTSIDSYAFSATDITSIIIPSSVTSIGDEVLENCYKLSSIVVDSANTVYDSRNNSNAIIETATNKLIQGSSGTVIPNTVTSIGYSAFSGIGITNITIPNSVTSIENYAFEESKIQNITIPGSVTSIGKAAFEKCPDLTSVVIENGVTSIGDYAFRFAGLASLTIPSSVTSIGKQIATYNSNLSSIVVDANNSKYDSRDNCNAIIETATNKLILGSSGTVIPNTVTSIGDYAFADTGITSIIIPGNVTTIDTYAFDNAVTLSSVVIENGVTSIGYNAFDNTRLTSLTIPSSVTSIGKYGYSFLVGSPSLSSIVVDPNNPVYDSRNNCNAIIETATNKLIQGSNNTIIPNSVTSIGASAFVRSGITNITIPNSVTSIGGDAFWHAEQLSTIVIPNTITKIEYETFRGSGIESIYIPSSVSSIAKDALIDCPNLSTIYVQSNSLVSLLNGKYDSSRTTVIVDPSKF